MGNEKSDIKKCYTFYFRRDLTNNFQTFSMFKIFIFKERHNFTKVNVTCQRFFSQVSLTHSHFLNFLSIWWSHDISWIYFFLSSYRSIPASSKFPDSSQNSLIVLHIRSFLKRKTEWEVILSAFFSSISE